MYIRHRTLLTLSCLMLVSLAWAGPSDDEARHRAGGMHGPGADMHGMMMRHLAHAIEQLDLTEEQRDAIHQLVQDGREEMHANHTASMENMRAMHELMQADELDDNALAQVARKSGQLAEERVMLAGRNLHAILAELDAAQREQLRAMGEEMRQRHRHEWLHRDSES